MGAIECPEGGVVTMPKEGTSLKKRTGAIIGGVIAIVGVGWATAGHPPSTHPKAGSTIKNHHPATSKKTSKTPHNVGKKSTPTNTPIPTSYPAPPQSGQASGSATASFTTVTHHTPPVPLEVVTVPWQSGTHWAIEPVGMTMDGNANPTLWFGAQAAGGAWHWIPSTLPGALSAKFPIAIRQALQLGWDLSQHQPGPNPAVGNISWSAITGQVGKPTGWTLVSLSPANSPLGQTTLGLTVWQPSYTGRFNGFYGLQTLWDGTNAQTGTHDFEGFVANPGPMTAIAQHPPQS